MALSPSVNDRNADSFKDVSGETARRVSVVESITVQVSGTVTAIPSGNDYRVGGMIDGVICDYSSASGTYVTSIVTLYKNGGASGTLLKTVTDVYDASGNYLTTTAV